MCRGIPLVPVNLLVSLYSCHGTIRVHIRMNKGTLRLYGLSLLLDGRRIHEGAEKVKQKNAISD